ERRDKILYICYDNEAYMNTGIQGSSSTPMFASTTTTPAGKRTVRKDLVGIAMAHDIPYAATASISNLTDLRRKVQKAKDTQGPSLVHVHAPCPTGWRYASSKTVEVARKAVQTGCWALYEYEDGRTTVNYRPKELKPIEEYISLQGRFKNMTEDEKALMSANTENHFRRLIKRLDDMNA
ncbi:thiamine pyrophosphate-dependent enzyme, partial [Enterocloster bolteae]